MKTWSSKFPWHQHAAGESFFVTSLDVAITLNQGLRVGRRVLGRHVHITGRPGIHDGLLGVLFTVQPRRRRRDTSEPPPPDAL